MVRERTIFGKEKKMELQYFKDILFDLINEGLTGIREIIADDRENCFLVVMGDGSIFRVQCDQIQPQK